MRQDIALKGLLVLVAMLLALNTVVPFVQLSFSQAAGTCQYRVLALKGEALPGVDVLEELLNKQSQEGWEFMQYATGGGLFFKKCS
jgi:hypothetical protein